jgi:glucose/arabinose dehydrogenase
MISIVKRLAFAIATCFLLTGCSVDPLQTDVTPPVGSASGARALSPLPPDRFEGEPTRIGFEPIALQGGDFLQLMDFVFLPHTTDFLAVNRFGKVGYFRMESDVATMVDFFQIPAVHTEGDCGARSIALDPDFDANSIFYVAYCIDDQYDVVKRFEMSASDFSETVYSASNVAAVGDQKTDVSENAVGAMSFAKDGAMFVSVGDRHRGKYAQDFVNESGKIMRVVPLKQRRTSGFSVPAGNMPDTGPNGSKLLYAFGFSNPWRGSFDRLGRYWVADRGGASQEINVVTRVGENFGWPLADGRSCFALACSQTVQPIVSWDDSGDHRFILDDPWYAFPKRTGRHGWERSTFPIHMIDMRGSSITKWFTETFTSDSSGGSLSMCLGISRAMCISDTSRSSSLGAKRRMGTCMREPCLTFSPTLTSRANYGGLCRCRDRDAV